jgi:hypothetical protein
LERFPKALEEGSLRDAFVELLTAQKDDDEGKPLQERVGVGGEAHLLVIWRGRQMMWTCHRFADYPGGYRKVLARLADDATRKIARAASRQLRKTADAAEDPARTTPETTDAEA